MKKKSIKKIRCNVMPSMKVVFKVARSRVSVDKEYVVDSVQIYTDKPDVGVSIGFFNDYGHPDTCELDDIYVVEAENGRNVKVNKKSLNAKKQGSRKGKKAKGVSR